MTPLVPDGVGAAVLEDAAADYRLRRMSGLALPTLVILWGLFLPDQPIEIKLRGLCLQLRSKRSAQARALGTLVATGYLECLRVPARGRVGLYRLVSRPVKWAPERPTLAANRRTAA